MTYSSHHDCGRARSDKETPVADARFDVVEATVLQVARYYWQTFALPSSQSWLRALQVAEEAACSRTPGTFGLDVLMAVQAMRHSRKSCFQFNDPACPTCASFLTEHERQFMDVLKCCRAGRHGTARTHAMLLCEGNCIDRFIARVEALVAQINHEDSDMVIQIRHPQVGLMKEHFSP